MSEIIVGARTVNWADGRVLSGDKGELPIMDMPEKEQEYIRMVMEANNINAYKEALKAYMGENMQVPDENVAVVTIHGMGTKVFIGNEVYVPEVEVTPEVALLIETEARTVDEARDIVEKSIGREDRNPDISSLDDIDKEQKGNLENNEMTRAQRASLER